MKYKIKDVVNLNHSSIKKDELTNILYLDTANLNQNTINELTEYNFVIDKVPSRARRKVNNNDILLSTVRPNQEHYGILDNPPTNLIVSTGFAVLSPKKDIVNPNYLYAYLTQRRITDYLQIIAENSTSAYPSIKPSVIANLDIELPSMEKQNSIGEFSKSLENKIKLNNQIISTLEELASTLFKRWFVDYEFPDENGNPYKSSGGKMIESELGDIPEVWEVLNLADVSEDIITGKTPSTKEKENYGDEIPFIKIPDMHNNTYVVNTESSLSSLGSSLHPKKLLPKNTICVSCIATPGLVSITSEESHTNQQINAILPKKK
ncbi:Type I restriction-modification system DNA methylase [Brochothrix thermosphacta DSM 20171 = FSL F6-1036]|nr:Type I restriction-modification system DNA methylase [Brochothrix thermosphacta DSM 20171 = FSL F6-1036]